MFLSRRYSADGNYAPREPFELNKDSPQARGLVGWWPLGKGRVMLDKSGYGRHATAVSSVQYQSSSFGLRAPRFLGGDDFTAAAIAEVDGASQLTMSFWAFSANYASSDAGFAIYSGTLSANFIGLYPFDTSGGNGVRLFHTGGSSINQNDGAIADDQPHHFIYTARSSTDHELFVDGVSVGVSATLNTVPALDTTAFGHWKGTQDFTNGKAFDFRIEARGISAQEAWERFNPSTRWDLYWQPRPMVSVLAFPAGGVGGPIGPGWATAAWIQASWVTGANPAWGEFQAAIAGWIIPRLRRRRR